MENNHQLSVELSQYALNSLSGFGESTATDLESLQKALEAGEITGRDTETQSATGGSVLKVESLENTLKMLNFAESDIVLWKQIPKVPAYNTVEEYNVQTDYGRVGSSFNAEGELPEEDDAVYARKSQLVKFMGTTRVISHPMQMVNVISGVGNVIQKEVQNGTMKILRDVDKAIIFANSSLIPQEFNGLFAQHASAYTTLAEYYGSEVVFDLRGKAIKDANIEAGALTIVQNYGNPTDLFGPPAVLSDYAVRFHESKLISPNSAQVSAGEMGQNVVSTWTQFGKITLNFDKFMRAPAPKTTASGATHGKAPSAPTTVTAALATDTTTKYAGQGGDYKFAASAVNRYGESALTVVAAVQTVAVTEVVDLTITPAASTYAATAYNIYKSVKDQATGTVAFYFLYSVSAAELAAGHDGGAAGKVREKNRIMPKTEVAFMLEKTNDIFAFKQLAPLMKMDLAILGPATRFMILLYGTPVLYAPKKFVKYINIGTDLT